MENTFKKDKELITALIIQKTSHINKTKKFINDTSEKLDKVKADLEEAKLGDDPNKVSSLTVKKDMLTARLTQAEGDLKKLDTKQNIPEKTYEDIMGDIQNKSSDIYWDYQHKLSEKYAELCQLIDDTRETLLEADGLAKTVNRELYVRTDSSGYEKRDDVSLVGVEGDRIKNALYQAILGAYGKLS